MARLDGEERNDFLLRLAQGEAHLSATLNRRLRALAPWPGAELAPRRTVGELLADLSETPSAMAQRD